MKAIFKSVSERLNSKSSDTRFAPATRHYFFNYQR